MDTLEQNKQIVQEGLNKRANERKKAIFEAEQENITAQMIGIVNKNAENNAKHHENAKPTNTAKLLRRKKIAAVKECGSTGVKGIWISVSLFAVSSILYATGLTELCSAALTSIVAIVMFILNTFTLIANAGELAELINETEA